MRCSQRQIRRPGCRQEPHQGRFGVLCLLLLPFVVGSAAAQQQTSSVTPVSASTPVLGADFALPLGTEDWQHLPFTEDCERAVERVLDSVAKFPQDTVLPDPFAPIPPTAIQVGRACLQHFQVAALQNVERDVMIHIGSWIGDDSMVQAIVTQRLAELQHAPIPDRAQVLEDAVHELMRAYRTPEKTHLAQTLMAEGDALGPEATMERLAMHREIEEPVGPYDPAAQLAYDRTVIGIMRQAPPAIKARGMDGPHGYINYLEMKAAWLEWLKTGADSDYHTWLDAYHRVMLTPDSLLGTAAPPVTGAYWFNTPQSGSAPMAPVAGKVNLLVFLENRDLSRDRDKDPYFLYKMVLLQHLHQAFPQLQITLIVRNTGVFAGRLLAAAPDSEAKMMHRYFTDSLHIPGVVCVEGDDNQRLPNGWIHHALTADVQHNDGGYGHDADDNSMLVDAQGRIVKDMVLGMMNQLPELEYIIRQLQTMARTPSLR